MEFQKYYKFSLSRIYSLTITIKLKKVGDFMSKAIVLVAFGSANLEGIKQSIGLLEQDLNEYFAGEYTVLKAFTSNKIIELLKERHDYVIPHLSKALFNLVNQGYEEVIIQPLHIMSTSDIKRIEEVVDEYKYSMKRIVICNTLFSDEEEVLIKESNEIANIIWDDSEKNDILLVGHGSKKNSNKIYDVITEAVRNKSNKKVYLATLEGEKTLDLAIEEILKDDTKKLTLKSLFIIPGKHVIDDILNSNDSWSEKIKSKGIEITIGKKSLLQYEKIREMYITKINNVIRNIK